MDDDLLWYTSPVDMTDEQLVTVWNEFRRRAIGRPEIASSDRVEDLALELDDRSLLDEVAPFTR